MPEKGGFGALFCFSKKTGIRGFLGFVFGCEAALEVSRPAAVAAALGRTDF